MAHRPTLYIGIGGSGCKTLSLIKNNFIEKYGYGKIPEYIRFFCIDTDTCINESLADDTYIIGNEDSTPEAYLNFNTINKTGLCDWYIDNDNAHGASASRAYARLAMEMSHKNILAKIISEYSSTLFGLIYKGKKKEIEERAQAIAIGKQNLLLREYGIEIMNVLIALAEKYKEKIGEYNKTLHNVEVQLRYSIEESEEHLSSSSSQFVYDITVMYWKEFAKDIIPNDLTINLLDDYLDSEYGSSSMINHILQRIGHLHSVSYYKRIPLEFIIINMGTSSIRQLCASYAQVPSER